jgi:hypothetical protein
MKDCRGCFYDSFSWPNHLSVSKIIITEHDKNTIAMTGGIAGISSGRRSAHGSGKSVQTKRKLIVVNTTTFNLV